MAAEDRHMPSEMAFFLEVGSPSVPPTPPVLWVPVKDDGVSGTYRVAGPWVADMTPIAQLRDALRPLLRGLRLRRVGGESSQLTGPPASFGAINWAGLDEPGNEFGLVAALSVLADLPQRSLISPTGWEGSPVGALRSVLSAPPLSGLWNDPVRRTSLLGAAAQWTEEAIQADGGWVSAPTEEDWRDPKPFKFVRKMMFPLLVSASVLDGHGLGMGDLSALTAGRRSAATMVHSLPATVYALVAGDSDMAARRLSETLPAGIASLPEFPDAVARVASGAGEGGVMEFCGALGEALHATGADGVPVADLSRPPQWWNAISEQSPNHTRLTFLLCCAVDRRISLPSSDRPSVTAAGMMLTGAVDAAAESGLTDALNAVAMDDLALFDESLPWDAHLEWMNDQVHAMESAGVRRSDAAAFMLVGLSRLVGNGLIPSRDRDHFLDPLAPAFASAVLFSEGMGGSQGLAEFASGLDPWGGPGGDRVWPKRSFLEMPSRMLRWASGGAHGLSDGLRPVLAGLFGDWLVKGQVTPSAMDAGVLPKWLAQGVDDRGAGAALAGLLLTMETDMALAISGSLPEPVKSRSEELLKACEVVFMRSRAVPQSRPQGTRLGRGRGGG